MNSMKLAIPLHFISCKKTPSDAVTPQRQSQFTPKMKANAVPRLFSSLVLIDQYYECNGMTSSWNSSTSLETEISFSLYQMYFVPGRLDY